MKSFQTEPANVNHSFDDGGRARFFLWMRPTTDKSPVGGWFKRSFDVSASVMLLIVLSPLMFGLALLILSTSSGGVLFGHRRVGHNHHSFRCYKLRTMVENGEAVLEEHFQRYPQARDEWAETQKLREDPRVTPVGHVLRKFSLDELPQLFNVVLGDMSLVGPRPVPDHELRRYGRSARYYLSARPGITGLWQVSGRSNTTYRRRIACDRAYVTKFSPKRDFMILSQTLPAAIRSSETA